MNLAELNQAPGQEAAPVQQAPPRPPPLRPNAKRPSCEPSDVAIRSPPREIRENQNPNHAVYAKYAKSQERLAERPVTPNKAPPLPVALSPAVCSPKRNAVSPAVSPVVHSSKSKNQHRQKEKHSKDNHQKEKEESSESVPEPVKGKSPGKTPKAESPSVSDAEANQDNDKNSSPIVFFIRLVFYIFFALFCVFLIFWVLALATSLHWMNIEFFERKFMEHD